jgi:hypothetical protein
VPTNRGAAQTSLVIEMSSATGQFGVSYKQRYSVPISGSARMPTIFLSDHALPPVVPVRPFPPIGPHPVSLQPELRVLDFGATQPGQTASASFWVRNTGDAPLTVQQPINFNQSHFDIVIPSTLPATVPPGGDVEVPCMFLAESTPGVVSSGRFQILSDDPVRPGVMLDLIGRAAGPHLTQPNETYDFGPLTQPTTATLTFRSDGTSPVTLRSLTLSGSAFAATATPTVPGQLAPGSELKIDVTPTGHGPLQETLLLEHDGNPSHKSFVVLKAMLP